MTQIKWIFLLVLVVALSVLFAENSNNPVPIKFPGVEQQYVEFYYVVGLSLAVGALFMFLVNMVREIQLRGRIRTLTRELKDRDREIAELRSLPLSDLDGDAEGS